MYKLTRLLMAFSMLSLTSVFACACPGKTAAALPPYYLQVPGWQTCTQEKQMGSWKSVCLPQQKPAACAPASWKDLEANAKLPAC